MPQLRRRIVRNRKVKHFGNKTDTERSDIYKTVTFTARMSPANSSEGVPKDLLGTSRKPPSGSQTRQSKLSRPPAVVLVDDVDGVSVFIVFSALFDVQVKVNRMGRFPSWEQ